MNKLIPMEHYRELVWRRAINSLLLRVLKETLRLLVTVDGFPDKGKGRTTEQQQAFDLARAAIAKAEGRQP